MVSCSLSPVSGKMSLWCCRSVCVIRLLVARGCERLMAAIRRWVASCIDSMKSCFSMGINEKIMSIWLWCSSLSSSVTFL